MRRFRALFRTMPTSPMIDRRTAERLLTGDATGVAVARDHADLRRLLSAARAGARPQELTGERAAVAAFVRARRGPVRAPSKADRRRTLGRPARRMVLVKVAAGMSLAVVGGAALAAETGMLPDSMQQQAHDLFSVVGVPPPSTGRAGGPGQGGNGDPSAFGNGGRVPHPNASAMIELCRAWRAAEKDPRDKAMAADKLRDLTDAAGDSWSIPAFCARLLDGEPAQDGPPPDIGSTKRSNDNGRSGHPSPSLRK